MFGVGAAVAPEVSAMWVSAMIGDFNALGLFVAAPTHRPPP